MNLDEALAADAAMRPKLLQAIAQKHQLDSRAIGKVDVCQLGGWLHGEAMVRCQFLKSYRPCVEAHDAFHGELEKVARQINLGEYEDGTAMLASGTACTKAFLSMVAALRQLKAEAKL